MKIRIAIKYSLLLIIGFILINFVKTNQDDFEFLHQIHYSDLLVILILTFVSTVLEAYRFYSLVTLSAKAIHYKTCLQYFVVGGVLGAIVPQGANLYKSINLKIRNAVNYKRYFSYQIFLYWSLLASTLLVSTIFTGIFAKTLNIRGLNIFYTFLILCILHLFVPFCIKPLLRLFSTSNRSINKVLDQIRTILSDFHIITKNYSLLSQNLLLILLNIVTGMGILYFTFKGIGLLTPTIDLLIYISIIRLSNVIQITPGNLGVREFILGFLTDSMGFNYAAGITVALIARLTLFLVQGLLSIFLIFTDKFEKHYSTQTHV